MVRFRLRRIAKYLQPLLLQNTSQTTLVEYTDNHQYHSSTRLYRDCRGRMVVECITNVVSSNPAHGEVYSIQHYVIKFVSSLRQVSGFLWVLCINQQYIKRVNDCCLTPNEQLFSFITACPSYISIR